VEKAVGTAGGDVAAIEQAPAPAFPLEVPKVAHCDCTKALSGMTENDLLTLRLQELLQRLIGYLLGEQAGQMIAPSCTRQPAQRRSSTA